MDKKQFESFYNRYTEYLESEEGKLEYLAHIYILLNQCDILQDFVLMETNNSAVH